ncbi:Hpt domain-containing protein [Oxalobacteraceae bacterium CAVE-383]|nr:Hpt domain-containing protein [Oxalobacteraceae bacterium CAVE-383]
MRIVAAAMTADLNELADCAVAADIARLGKAVHRIHGGMALLEMRPAAALCRTIEECMAFEWIEASWQLVPPLREMLMRIRDDIDPDGAGNPG